MNKICLQSGHFGHGGGAPNELATNKRITDRLSAMLRERGFEVTQTDWYGYNDPAVTKTDFALFLALHCDMDYPNDGGSGFADYAAEDLGGAGYAESQRICAVINNVYFLQSGIKYVSHSNVNTKRYFMWQYLTDKTPCVLLEMGQSIDPHDSVLLGNTDLIASSIARAICVAFGVNYETTVPPVVIPPAPIVDTAAFEKEISDLKVALQTEKTNSENAFLIKTNECTTKINGYKDKIINFINTL